MWFKNKVRHSPLKAATPCAVSIAICGLKMLAHESRRRHPDHPFPPPQPWCRLPSLRTAKTKLQRTETGQNATRMSSIPTPCLAWTQTMNLNRLPRRVCSQIRISYVQLNLFSEIFGTTGSSEQDVKSSSNLIWNTLCIRYKAQPFNAV
jgi:hypothetical protein